MMNGHITFQVIPLALGFGIGYWLLVTANHQESVLKNVGKLLGWGLIAIAIIATMVSNYYTNKEISGFYPYGCCPMHRMMQQRGVPVIEIEETEIEKPENPSTMNKKKMNEIFKNHKNKPIMNKEDNGMPAKQ